MEKIIGIYRITNTITGDFYIGSSKDVKHRLACHKIPSTWDKCPNNPMYQDFQKYGIDKFEFEILAEVEEAVLKEAEQEFIETLKPTYNDRNAKGLDIERQKEYQKKYEKTDKRKKAKKEYNKSDKCKEHQKKYNNQLCYFNNETLTLCALQSRFKRKGIPHPQIEAKKYLIKR